MDFRGTSKLGQELLVLASITGAGTKWRYASKAKCPGELKVTSPKSPSTIVSIKRYDPQKAQRTLGTYLAPDGSCKKQVGDKA